MRGSGDGSRNPALLRSLYTSQHRCSVASLGVYRVSQAEIVYRSVERARINIRNFGSTGTGRYEGSQGCPGSTSELFGHSIRSNRLSVYRCCDLRPIARSARRPESILAGSILRFLRMTVTEELLCPLASIGNHDLLRVGDLETDGAWAMLHVGTTDGVRATGVTLAQ